VILGVESLTGCPRPGLAMISAVCARRPRPKGLSHPPNGHFRARRARGAARGRPAAPKAAGRGDRRPYGVYPGGGGEHSSTIRAWSEASVDAWVGSDATLVSSYGSVCRS